MGKGLFLVISELGHLWDLWLGSGPRCWDVWLGEPARCILHFRKSFSMVPFLVSDFMTACYHLVSRICIGALFFYDFYDFTTIWGITIQSKSSRKFHFQNRFWHTKSRADSLCPFLMVFRHFLKKSEFAKFPKFCANWTKVVKKKVHDFYQKSENWRLSTLLAGSWHGGFVSNGESQASKCLLRFLCVVAL